MPLPLGLIETQEPAAPPGHSLSFEQTWKVVVVSEHEATQDVPVKSPTYG
jgi:hypothetical protein